MISRGALSRVNTGHPGPKLVSMKLQEDIDKLANACGNQRYPIHHALRFPYITLLGHITIEPLVCINLNTYIVHCWPAFLSSETTTRQPLRPGVRAPPRRRSRPRRARVRCAGRRPPRPEPGPDGGEPQYYACQHYGSFLDLQSS